MKRLYLIRHAKSSWNTSDVRDFDRPLNDRGKTDAPLMGKRLKTNYVQPDLIVTSPAKRARKTAKLIAKELDFPKKRIVEDEAIYLASLQELLKVLRNIDDSYHNVCLIGHNPGLTDLANCLADCQIDNIPTCGVFCVDFDIHSWKDVTEGKGMVVFFDYPKNQA